MSRQTLSAITEADCWSRLRAVPVGRIAYQENGTTVIRPVNFSVLGKSIVIWTVPGSHGSMVAGQTVAFEIDRIDSASHSGWTVLCTGPAIAVTDVEALVDAVDFPRRPWVAVRNDQVIKIQVDRISGFDLTPITPH